MSSESLMSIDQSIHFLCGSGEIISALGRCDHTRDCLDNSDELDCEELGKTVYTGIQSGTKSYSTKWPP